MYKTSNGNPVDYVQMSSYGSISVMGEIGNFGSELVDSRLVSNNTRDEPVEKR
jgi:hypothetical protein